MDVKTFGRRCLHHNQLLKFTNPTGHFLEFDFLNLGSILGFSIHLAVLYLCSRTDELLWYRPQRVDVMQKESPLQQSNPEN